MRAAGGRDRRFPFIGRTYIGERQRREALRDLEDAGEILRAFHITREPIEVVGGTREHATKAADIGAWLGALRRTRSVRLAKIPFRRIQPLPSSSIQYPGVLRPAALAGVDHEGSFLQRHAGEPAWHDADAIASRQNEWAQIDVAGCDPFVDAGGACGQRQRGLRDEILRIGFELDAETRDGRLVRCRSNQHAIAARAVHFLDDELVEMVEYVREM